MWRTFSETISPSWESTTALSPVPPTSTASVSGPPILCPPRVRRTRGNAGRRAGTLVRVPDAVIRAPPPGGVPGAVYRRSHGAGDRRAVRGRGVTGPGGPSFLLRGRSDDGSDGARSGRTPVNRTLPAPAGDVALLLTRLLLG